MRSLKLSRRGTPISATERAEKSWSLVLAVRSAEDVMTVVTSGRFPSIGHLTELLSKRAVERVSNVTPTTDQIEGDQPGTEAKQAAKARKVTGPRLMTVIPTKTQPAIRTWQDPQER